MLTPRTSRAVHLSRAALLLTAAVLSGGLASSAIAQPIYVDDATGNDLNPGSKAFPVKSIDAGIALAAGGTCPVYVAGGTYSGFTLASGVRVHGGFNPATGWGRDGTVTMVTDANFTVTADGVSGAMIDQLAIDTANSTGLGQSMYAVYLQNSSGIIISNCVITPGEAGSGANGDDGTQGVSGGDGTPGQPGCEDGGTFCGSCSRPQGGNGGTSPVGNNGGKGGSAGLDTQFGFAGASGLGAGGLGGAGTPPGFGNQCPDQTYWGLGGDDGLDGNNGSGGASFGAFAGGFYQASNGTNGSGGTHGSGGGGGGGGGGGLDQCDSYGTGGGGGGGGAQGGGSGTSGLGGGGSFAVFAIATSDITIVDSSVIADDGGDGGNGGLGGLGGVGGDGYQTSGGCGASYGGSGEQDDGSMGARGGDGGSGGMGGDGGGGGGGPSIALYADSGTVAVGSSVFIPGTPGQGGSSMNPGADGVAQSVMGNTAPATIDTDCNQNGLYDVVDIANGTLLDADCDGIPDSCDEVCVFSADINGDGVLDNGDILTFVEAFLAGCL